MLSESGEMDMPLTEDNAAMLLAIHGVKNRRDTCAAVAIAGGAKRTHELVERATGDLHAEDGVALWWVRGRV